MTKDFLETAYAERDVHETQSMYNAWSKSYEADMGGNGYATPARSAAGLAEFATDLSLPLLDFGCGTGLAGQAFKDAGFSVIDGTDLSPEMIAQAEAKQVYRNLQTLDAEAPIPQDYPLMAAVGVIGAGAAPLSMLGSLLHALTSGGLLVFSFNDHALADPQSVAHLNEWLDCGAARLLFAEHGEHLPAQGIESTVYVVEKA